MLAIIFIILCGTVCLGAGAMSVGAIASKNRSFILAGITLVIAIIAGILCNGIIAEWKNYNDVNENHQEYMDAYTHHFCEMDDIGIELLTKSSDYLASQNIIVTEDSKLTDLLEVEGLVEFLGTDLDKFYAEKDKMETARTKLVHYETFSWMF